MNNKNYINTGQGTADEVVAAMFKDGGMGTYMTTNEPKSVKEDAEENAL